MLHPPRTALLCVLTTLATLPAAAQVAATDVPVRAAIVPASPAAAFEGATSPPPTAMPTWGSLFTTLPKDLHRLPTKTNGLWLAGAGALALGLYSQDAELTRSAVSTAPLEFTLDAGARVGGGLVQVGGALGTFAIGRLSGHPVMASIGSDLVRAQIIETALVQVPKVAVGRRRPDGTRFSFPSGHASISFATATVLQRRLGWKAGVPASAMATYVAASRLSENKHYLSDVVVGAALGIISGRAVTVGHGAAGTFALSPLVSPHGAGIAFTRVTSR